MAQDTAEFIKEITVQEETPFGTTDVPMSLFKVSGGALFAIDTFFLDQVLEGNTIQLGEGTIELNYII